MKCRNSRIWWHGDAGWMPRAFASARMAAFWTFPWSVYQSPCQANKLPVTLSIAMLPRRSAQSESCNVPWNNYERWLRGCISRAKKKGEEWLEEATTSSERVSLQSKLTLRRCFAIWARTKGIHRNEVNQS